MSYNYEGGAFRTGEVQSFSTYQANQPFQLDLVQGQNLTFLLCTLEVNYSVPSGATTPPSTPVEDGVAKLVSALQLTYGGGAGTPVAFQGLQQANLYGNHIFGGYLRNDQPQALSAGSSATAYVDCVFFPSLNHNKDIQDGHYAIPGEADHVENIQVTGNWGNLSNMFGTPGEVQIDSAKFTVPIQSAWTFSPNMGQMKNALGVTGNGMIAMPNYNRGNYPWQASVSDVGLDLDLPTDKIIRRIFLIAKDSNGDRSDSIIDDFALRTSDGTDLLGRMSVDPFTRLRAERLDLSSPSKGCLYIDMVEDVRENQFASKNAGLLLKKQDKLAFRFGTTAPGSIDYLFDTVKMYNVFSA